MIYTPLTKRAMKIAFEAHKDQADKSGLPYIYHPIHLAEQMDDEQSICVALLHDVIEDTKITIDKLKKQGFGDDILNALHLLTHDKSVPYMDYIRKIKENQIATKVKLADLKHNSDLTRIDKITEKDLKRVQKYKTAIELLINKTKVTKMSNENKPCIAFEMEDLTDAMNHMEYEVVERYGDKCNGKFLHTWDDGERYLCKCKKCGGYILIQKSEFHSGVGDDSYYTDFFPVNGSDEAKELNEMYNGFEIEQKFPKKYIMETNGQYAWHENGDS